MILVYLAWESVMPNLCDQHFVLNLNYSLGSVTKPTHLVKDDVSTTVQMSGKWGTAGGHLPFWLGAATGA